MSLLPSPCRATALSAARRLDTIDLEIELHSSMLKILRAGKQNTVQDLGRTGYRHLGVARAGALDLPALAMANRLVANPAHLAGLEVVVGTLEVQFLRDAWFAICGADFESSLDEQPQSIYWRTKARAGQRLVMRGARSGMRAYLTIDGGIDVPEVMRSRSTDLQAGFGGWKGRCLQAGDLLPLGAPQSLAKPIGTLHSKWTPTIRAIPGPEYEEFNAASREQFWSQAWLVTNQSNRMAYRLQGPVLQRKNQNELASHAVMPGVVQVPANGQPIVLLADAQTTGGYPKIACVIEADLWKFAQAPAGRKVVFVETDVAGALAAKKQLQQELYRFEWSAYG